MRVTFVSHGATLNGAERSLLEVVAGLLKAGDDVNVVLPRLGPLDEELRAIGVAPVVAPVHWWVARPDGEPAGRRWARGARSLPAVTDAIRRSEPDVVVTNSSVTPWPAIAARRLGVPHAWWVREFVREGLGWRFDLGERASYRAIAGLSAAVVANS